MQTKQRTFPIRAYVDCMTPAVSYDWMLSNGYMADETHENLQGNQYLAQFVWNELGFFALGTPHTLGLQWVQGQLKFQFGTASGIRYGIESSSNLLDWVPAFTLDGSGQPASVSLPPVGPYQSYRLHLAPSGN